MPCWCIFVLNWFLLSIWALNNVAVTGFLTHFDCFGQVLCRVFCFSKELLDVIFIFTIRSFCCCWGFRCFFSFLECVFINVLLTDFNVCKYYSKTETTRLILPVSTHSHFSVIDGILKKMFDINEDFFLLTSFNPEPLKVKSLALKVLVIYHSHITHKPNEYAKNIFDHVEWK